MISSFSRKQNILLVLVILMCFTSLFTATALEICNADERGTAGMWYTFWTDGQGSVCATMGDGGQFSVQWSNCGNFVIGKGWATGSENRTITWSGSASGAQYFGLYGWMKNPLVEYYIPRSGGSQVGTYQADGTTYTLGIELRVDKPSIEGTATFEQYFASGSCPNSVNFSQHCNGWRSLGKSVGSQDYQVVAVEGWGGSSGTANVTVGTGSGSTTTTTSNGATPPPTSTTSTSSGSCSGECIWYGTAYPLCCNTASGWGWENNQSCISESTCLNAGQTVTGSSGSTTTTTSNQGSTSSTTTSNGGSTTTTSNSSSGCSGLPEWNSSTVYYDGDQVQYNGKSYEANWYSQNQNPETNSGAYMVWTLLGSC
jgi:endo-1,4-beta-xylanase